VEKKKKENKNKNKNPPTATSHETRSIQLPGKIIQVPKKKKPQSIKTM